ncbi:hypothetical protein ASA1KI_42890 [Opitutales bacterium ASA1]|uniref:nucleotidyltransferase family protein n=1 Tax=Congregicoccus parvus TaxID=3081749 RepID=UPI002B2B99DC|nr:hypothetical protein ASA1KI_42890 [Opitutales bacterium ASA1]
MVSVLHERSHMIAEACRRHGVERLDVFGSASRGDPAFRDVDLIVRFTHPESPGYADRYLALAEALEEIFGHPVDLLTERSLRNPIFVAEVNRDRRTVYAAA